MASWAAVYLIKRAGYSEKAVNGLIDMLYRSWAGQNVPRAVATSRALAANAYRRVGLNPLLSKGMPKPELMPNLKLDAPGLGGFYLVNKPGTPDVQGEISYRLLPRQALTYGKRPVMGFPLGLTYLQSRGEGRGRFFQAQSNLLARMEQMSHRHKTPLMIFGSPGRQMMDPRTGLATWDALPMWAQIPYRKGGFTHWMGKIPGGQYESAHELTAPLRSHMLEDPKSFPTGTFLRLTSKVPLRNLKDPAELDRFEDLLST